MTRKKIQRVRNEECPSCGGVGKTTEGSCDRGCCEPFFKVKCYRCAGKGTIKMKLVTKKEWVQA